VQFIDFFVRSGLTPWAGVRLPCGSCQQNRGNDLDSKRRAVRANDAWVRNRRELAHSHQLDDVEGVRVHHQVVHRVDFKLDLSMKHFLAVLHGRAVAEET
jgi:hypothetical protein